MTPYLGGTSNLKRAVVFWRNLIATLLLGGLFLINIATTSSQTPVQTDPTDPVERALRLNDQALKLNREGRYEEAIPLAEEALAIGEKVWRTNRDNNHDNLATLHTNLADLYEKSGNRARAEASYERALAIYTRLGRETLEVARTLNNLAGLLRGKRDYLNAEPLYERALKIRQDRLGPKHSLVAQSLDNMARIYSERGDYQHAIEHHREAVAIYRKEKDADKDLAISLQNLALAYTETGDYALAEPLFREALVIRQKLQDVEPSLLNGLARLLRRKGDLKGAERFYQSALAIYEAKPNVFAEDFAVTLNNLGVLYPDFARAEALYLRALAIADKVFGSEHPAVASMLNNLSGLYESKGRTAEAIALRTRANRIGERNLTLMLATGSEDDKRRYLETLLGETAETIWLHVHSAPMNKKAARLALTTILQRKGRVLDAVADQFSVMRVHASFEDKNLLDQLTVLQSQLANLKFSPNPTAEGQLQIAELAAKADRLEATISRKSAEFRMQSQPITLERIQEAIPEGAALVEIYPYFSYALAKANDSRFAVRYVAYVLRREGDPAFVSLGKTEAIGKAVRELREALAYPESANAKKAGRALDELLMRRLRPLLGGVKHILLSPTHELNVVPFAALVDEQNRYLIEKYNITYLTSGRDLLRINVPVRSKQEPFIIANPAFGATIADPSPTPSPTIASESIQSHRGMFQAQWTELEGTEEEAAIIKGLFPRARVLTGSKATEAAVKGIRAPQVLHLSTHGFFLPKPAPESPNQESSGAPVEIDNPLLRSGLIFAGANKRQSGGGEDGILTALEASTLDLFGTKLVVLSACETGLGDFRRIGEGVYGLRRALVLAGSASQIMSLWQVDTATTRELMVKYYEKLMLGRGRSEALREVQLEMLKRSDRAHPFYWASFMPIGDWRDIEK